MSSLILLCQSRAFALTAALVVAGCGAASATQPMQASEANITGEGTVQATLGDNGNTTLQVRVKHLAQPSRVAEDASTYVVWIQPHNADIQNVGALRIDDDLIGKLDTKTPHRAFLLTVTPEPNGLMAHPTHKAVFSSDVNRAD